MRNAVRHMNKGAFDTLYFGSVALFATIATVSVFYVPGLWGFTTWLVALIVGQVNARLLLSWRYTCTTCNKKYCWEHTTDWQRKMFP